MFFSVMTKNFNWEISTKNLVSFKWWDEVNDKFFLILWEFTEKSDFFGGGGGEGCMKKSFEGGEGVNRLKMGAWIVCKFKRGLGKRRGHVFEMVRRLKPQYTLWVGGAFLLTQISKANNIATQYYC